MCYEYVIETWRNFEGKNPAQAGARLAAVCRPYQSCERKSFSRSPTWYMVKFPIGTRRESTVSYSLKKIVISEGLTYHLRNPSRYRTTLGCSAIVPDISAESSQFSKKSAGIPHKHGFDAEGMELKRTHHSFHKKCRSGMALSSVTGSFGTDSD